MFFNIVLAFNNTVDNPKHNIKLSCIIFGSINFIEYNSIIYFQCSAIKWKKKKMQVIGAYTFSPGNIWRFYCHMLHNKCGEKMHEWSTHVCHTGEIINATEHHYYWVIPAVFKLGVPVQHLIMLFSLCSICVVNFPVMLLLCYK